MICKRVEAILWDSFIGMKETVLSFITIIILMVSLSLSLSLSLVLADFLFQFGCDSVAKTNDANNVLMESFSKYHQLWMGKKKEYFISERLQSKLRWWGSTFSFAHFFSSLIFFSSFFLLSDFFFFLSFFLSFGSLFSFFFFLSFFLSFGSLFSFFFFSFCVDSFASNWTEWKCAPARRGKKKKKKKKEKK